MYPSQKQNIVILEMMSEPNSSHWKRAILQTLKIHTKLMKIATTVIFCIGDQEKKEIYISEKKWGLVALKQVI